MAGGGRPARSWIDRTRTRDRLLKVISVLLAHGLAMLTLVISIRVWTAWRSPDLAIEAWSLLALACLLCLHPFAALGVSAVLTSPSDAIGIARSLTPRPVLRWLRTRLA